MATIGGTRRDPFFHAAGEQVLTGTLLAAALDPTACLAEVVEWPQQAAGRHHRPRHGRRRHRSRRPPRRPLRSGRHRQRHLPNRAHRHQSPHLAAKPALGHPTGHVARTRPRPARARPLGRPRPHSLHPVPAVQRRRGYRRPHRRGDRGPAPRHRRTQRPSPRRTPRPTRGRRARRGREHLPHPRTTAAVLPLRLPWHPGPHHAPELPTRRRSLGQPGHGRSLVSRHDQACRPGVDDQPFLARLPV